MTTAIKGGKIFKNGEFLTNDLFVADAREISGREFVAGNNFDFERVINIDNSFILPSLCDVHVHFREPGQTYKETIKTGSMAAARGGYTTVCTMPNLNPVPSTEEGLLVQLEAIKKNAVIDVVPYGTITKEQNGRGVLSDMDEISKNVCAFSDDGVGVQDIGLMKDAMYKAKELGKIIVAHCEDMSLLRTGKVRESEWKQIERDLKLADETGAAYHVCHISCKESVEVIREAKKSGVDVTCETAPHYLLLDSATVQNNINKRPDLGGAYKMNPPIKDIKDKIALIDGIIDGTLDIIATDHAPHSKEEKSRGFLKSPNGITGLECAFSVLFTGLVKKNIVSLEDLIRLMSIAPRNRFGLKQNGWIIVNTEEQFTIDSSKFVSMGKCTPFDGANVFGKIMMTILNDKIVFENTEG